MSNISEEDFKNYTELRQLYVMTIISFGVAILGLWQDTSVGSTSIISRCIKTSVQKRPTIDYIIYIVKTIFDIVTLPFAHLFT